MATTAKDASHGKEKSRSHPSNPQHIDPPHVRRIYKPSSTPDDKAFSFLSGKSTPHYLKHTVSSGKDNVCKDGKKQVSDDTTLKHTPSSRRKSLEKPPSLSQLQRTLSASGRGRTLKPSSPPPKNKASSPKPVLEQTSKTSRILKSQPVFTKPRNIKKSTISTSTPKKETKATTSSSTTMTPSSDLEVAESQGIKLEKEDKATTVQEVEEETIKFINEEELDTEILPLLDPSPIEVIEIEPNNSLDEKPINPRDLSTLSEEQVLSPTPHIEEAKEIIDEQVANEDEDDNNNIINNNKEFTKHGEEGQPRDETKEEKESKIEKPASMDDSNDENTPHKLNFRKGKELEEKKDEDEEGKRLQFKERGEDLGGIDDGKAEPENVVLKKQDVQGKKESQAYNDVIEETASKLVEKRKSKVKALVGAFETVISLQETEGQQGQQTE